MIDLFGQFFGAILMFLGAILHFVFGFAHFVFQGAADGTGWVSNQFEPKPGGGE